MFIYLKPLHIEHHCTAENQPDPNSSLLVPDNWPGPQVPPRATDATRVPPDLRTLDRRGVEPGRRVRRAMCRAPRRGPKKWRGGGGTRAGEVARLVGVSNTFPPPG